MQKRIETLSYKVTDTFHQLLIELYLCNKAMQYGVREPNQDLITIGSEKVELLRDYLPAILNGELTQKECPIQSCYPYIDISFNYEDATLKVDCRQSPYISFNEYTDIDSSSMLSRVFSQIDIHIAKLAEAKKLKGKQELQLTNDYTAVYVKGEDFVQVGCQKIPVDKVYELYEIVKKS